MPRGAGVDGFGIRKLWPDRPGGMAWTAAWDVDRRFSGQDPADLWFDADHGEGRFRVADGMLFVSGAHPRMHVRDPALDRQWRDIEVTMYFRARRRGPAYAGMVAVARTNHGISGSLEEDPCDSRGLGARMRYDGVVDVEKETVHPANVVLRARRLWPDGLPLERWIGFKYVVRDQGPKVKVEIWRDLAEGVGGGDWQRVLTVRDDGTGAGSEGCRPDVDPRAALTARPERLGSESGLPNLSVYFRTDDVGQEGLVYRWGSVREIG